VAFETSGGGVLWGSRSLEGVRETRPRRGPCDQLLPRASCALLLNPASSLPVPMPCARVQIQKQEFGLKPMNCPGHCLMFAAPRALLPRQAPPLLVAALLLGTKHIFP